MLVHCFYTISAACLAHLILLYLNTLKITSISKMRSNTIYIYIAKRCFYIACLNNYMFRPLYRPSSGCKLSYYKANYTIYNVLIFVDEISFTSKKYFKIIAVAVELRSYSNVKDINSIKGWVLWSGGGEV